MKKIILLITCFTAAGLFSQEIHDYKEELVHTFPIGSEKGEIGIILGRSAMGTDENQLTAIGFDSQDNLIVNDYTNMRTVIYNKDYSVKQTIKAGSFHHYIEDKGRFIFNAYETWRFMVIDKKNENVTEFEIPFRLANKITSASVFTDKVVFCYLKKGSLVSFVLEDLETLKYSEMLNTKQTLDLFNNKEKYGLEEYTLDNKNRIFYKGEIQNKDQPTLFEYWVEQHEKHNLKQPRKLPPPIKNYMQLKGVLAHFSGEDQDGNIYRAGTTSCLVFDKDGWVLDYFNFDVKAIVAGTADSKGNVYYLAKEKSNDEYVLNLYMIERAW